MIGEIKRDPASFRDPAAKVYASADVVYREIYPAYFKDYDLLMAKLYKDLVLADLLIPHKLLSRDENRIVIAPDRVPFISYPYEWSFETLKEAALTTLRVNRIALDRGMMLKDASAYNIQFYQGRMTLIDTTSFIQHKDGQPWPAYSQFLRHFLCPLLLMAYCHTAEVRLMEIYLDGIPVPYTSHRLPWLCKFDPGMWTHVYSQSLAGLFRDTGKRREVRMTRTALNGLLDNLYYTIKRLKYRNYKIGGWINYAYAGSYTPESVKSKREIVQLCLDEIRASTALDLGANTGEYSRIAARRGLKVLSVDSDHDCISLLHGKLDLLPLVVDLCNPSPAIGWANQERRSFWDRVGKVDLIMALALIHHLSIRNNIPLSMVAKLLAEHCRYLIVEWVPLQDKQAQKLLGSKRIPEYNLEAFTDAFSQYFQTGREYKINNSDRVIYLMERRING